MIAIFYKYLIIINVQYISLKHYNFNNPVFPEKYNYDVYRFCNDMGIKLS